MPLAPIIERTSGDLHAPAAGHEHARTMDTVYRRQRYIYDLTRRYYLFGRNEMIAALDARPGMHVLEIGCGTARNIIQTARRYAGTRVYGFDISAEMLKTAGAAVARAGLHDRIRLAEADATTFDGHALFGVEAFDRIFVSYSLSMIPGWQSVIARAVSQLGEGGSLHIVDFGDMSGLPVFARRGLLRWLGHFHVTPRRDLIFNARAIASREGLEAVSQHGRFGYAVHVTLRQPATRIA